MRADKVISTAEVHTAGEPFRIVTSGLPKLPGSTIVERRAWCADNLDYIRCALMHEPRGHADMYGAYLTDPVSPNADFGVIFMHNEGYSDHCGHGIIALATAAAELGWVNQVTPETRVGIDAPCGFIEAFVEWDGTQARKVRFVNVPSFIYKRDVMVETKSFGKVTGDISYGGAFYFYTDDAPCPILEENVEILKQFGDEVKRGANAAYKVVHPLIPEINHIYGTIVAGAPRHAGSTQANCCVFADREIDRSPTGSGTAGRVAQLHARGRLNGELVNESIIGSIFTGKVVGETEVAGVPAVIPEISGSAYVYGLCNWFLNENDPFRDGFLVR